MEQEGFALPGGVTFVDYKYHKLPKKVVIKMDKWSGEIPGEGKI
jgi:hypothetical protein